MLLNPIRNVLLLPRHNVHRLISIVQVIPSWALVWGITSPHHAEIIYELSLRSPNTTISPRAGAYVSPSVFEAFHYRTDNSLDLGQYPK